MRIFGKTRRKLERIIREEIDEPRERQAREIVVEAEEAARDATREPQGRAVSARRSTGRRSEGGH